MARKSAVTKAEKRVHGAVSAFRSAHVEVESALALLDADIEAKQTAAAGLLQEAREAAEVRRTHRRLLDQLSKFVPES